MTTKVINIKDKKALKVLESLESINFIEISKNDNTLSTLKPKNKTQGDSFFDLKGIWAHRDISLKQIREKAWGRQKL